MIEPPWTDEVLPQFNIVECSPKARLQVTASPVGNTDEPLIKCAAKYPFASLKVGQSFLVPFSTGIRRGALESAYRGFMQRHGRSFKVVLHKNLELFEVVRIA